MADEKLNFSYEGPVYARPVYRGVIIGHKEDNRVDINDVIIDMLGDRYSLSSGWSGEISIIVELKENENARPKENKADPPPA